MSILIDSMAKKNMYRGPCMDFKYGMKRRKSNWAGLHICDEGFLLNLIYQEYPKMLGKISHYKNYCITFLYLCHLCQSLSLNYNITHKSHLYSLLCAFIIWFCSFVCFSFYEVSSHYTSLGDMKLGLEAVMVFQRMSVQRCNQAC